MGGFCKPLNSTHGNSLPPKKLSGPMDQKTKPHRFRTPQEPAPDVMSGSQVRKMCQESGWDPQLVSRGWNQVKDTNRPIKDGVFFFFSWCFSFLGGNIRCFLNKSK